MKFDVEFTRHPVNIPIEAVMHLSMLLQDRGGQPSGIHQGRNWTDNDNDNHFVCHFEKLSRNN